MNLKSKQMGKETSILSHYPGMLKYSMKIIYPGKESHEISFQFIRTQWYDDGDWEIEGGPKDNRDNRQNNSAQKLVNERHTD